MKRYADGMPIPCRWAASADKIHRNPYRLRAVIPTPRSTLSTVSLEQALAVYGVRPAYLHNVPRNCVEPCSDYMTSFSLRQQP